VDGVEFHGTERGLSEEKYSHADQAQAVASRYQPGTQAVCHYNPENEGEAVLEVPCHGAR
jgi:hypothetical protein